MSFLEALGDLAGYGQSLIHRQRSCGYPFFQTLTLDVGHDDISGAFSLADFMHSADIGMVQRRCCLRFLDKAGLGLCVSGQLRGQKLECYGPLELRILRLIDNAHPPFPDLLEDFVVGDELPDHLIASTSFLFSSIRS